MTNENYADVEQMKDALVEATQSMHSAIEAAGIYYFEYYPEYNYSLQYNGKEDFGLREKEGNYPDCWFQKKITHPEDESILRHAFENIQKGAERETCDVRNQIGGEYRWNRYVFTSIYNTKGIRTKVVCTAQDITELKLAEKRIEEETIFQNGIKNDKVLLKTRANITKNTVEFLEIHPSLIDHGEVKRFTDGVHNLMDNAFSVRDQDMISESFSENRILKAVSSGEQYGFEYQRRDRDGHARWVKATVKAFSDPETSDVIVFVYLNDIHHEKNLNMIINRLAEIDYEIIALLHVDLNEIEYIHSYSDHDYMLIDFKLPYDQAIKKYIENYFVEEEKELAAKAFSIENIVTHLESDSVYEVSFQMQKEKNYHKKWEFSYLDDNKTSIIYTRTDITELLHKQEIQKQALSDALLLAEQASNAKTNFLSRMSHEIRTPMNAIIGMNTLAAQVADNPREVRECLAKIGISSRFLLSLINDILDMSRIESGKVIVNKRKFSLEELVNNINTIFYEQTEKKGIDYDCVIASFVSDYYVGDAMKLQQIIVNLLSNSVKFTEKGGKVQLIIRQERTVGKTAYMEFSVNDTGIGISKDFQEKMFEPFEQQDNSTTTPYKGTGLGLAISKNLVNMMGGTIQVHSIEGVGTEFIVRIPMDISEDDERYHKMNLNIAYEKLKTLIVDDDITICEHTQQLLAEMGMKAEWVESGYRAVEVIQNKWNHQEFFDVVLLDWKMPDMDGIETARKIRGIVGDDVTIIVMTAYDWSEIEVQAKQAGVNLLVTKPLFHDSLVSVFERAFQKKEEQKVQTVEEEYDFTDCRILLVEDHILNVEIAKKLLELKNAVVDVAENGLRAIEMFMEAGDYYYDAILMDIRMPVMDGITATKSIRQLRKKGAKTIPIIAMSANAFDEDVDKSKNAGMNEHLSKPIEPQILYATLDKWVNQAIEES